MLLNWFLCNNEVYMERYYIRGTIRSRRLGLFNYLFLMEARLTWHDLRFPKFRTGRPDHGRTGHFENEIGFFQEFLMKNDFLRAYYLGFDGSGWIALIKSEILITRGMACPVSSDQWQAPLA